MSATYQLVEIATGKVVLQDSTVAHVGYDIPGSQQRFAKQRAMLSAEDCAAKVTAEAIRNRLASYSSPVPSPEAWRSTAARRRKRPASERP